MSELFFVRKNARHRKIEVKDIRYIEADGSYLVIVTEKERFSLSQNLTQFLRKHPLPALVRIHRSYIVNVDLVDSFDYDFVYLKGDKVPIGESFRDKFHKLVKAL